MKIYSIRRCISTRAALKADWDDFPWCRVEALTLDHFLGDKPRHFPPTRIRLLYDAEGLCLHFHVADRYVRAAIQEHQGKVYQDSCVEFFFSPTGRGTEGYFNLEMNCGGFMLFRWRKAPGDEPVAINIHDIRRMDLVPSLPHHLPDEIQEPVTWRLVCHIPFAVLQNYSGFYPPRAGDIWRANFHKCADACSYPHWLCWSPILSPKINFHQPHFFGKLIFGGALQ